MTSHPCHRPLSALRARLIEDMNVRGFAEKTRNDHVRNVRAFAACIGRSPDTARRRICAASNCTRRRRHAAAKHQPCGRGPAFLLHRDARPAGPCPAAHGGARTAPAAGRPERRGVTLLLQAAPGPEYKAALATAGACPRAGRRPDPWGAGPRVSEIVALKVGDIDSKRINLVERL
jgi:integrase/recombinase XerD